MLLTTMGKLREEQIFRGEIKNLVLSMLSWEYLLDIKEAVGSLSLELRGEVETRTISVAVTSF